MFKVLAIPIIMVALAATANATIVWHPDSGSQDPTPNSGTYRGKVTKTTAFVDGQFKTTYHIVSDGGTSQPNPYGAGGHLDIPADDLDPAEIATLETAVTQNDTDNFAHVDDFETCDSVGTGPPYPG